MKFTLSILIILFITNSILSQSLTDSLKAHYKFENKLTDETFFNNDLELKLGKITYEQLSPSDNFIVFDGDTKVSTIKKFSNRDYKEISISFWFNSSTRTPQLQVMLQGAYMGFGIYLTPRTGKAIGFFDSTSSNSLESKDVLVDGKWHHIVLQSDGESTSMFIDGEFNGSIKEPMVVGNGGYNNKLFIGQSNLGVQRFIGSLNEIRIYSRVLSQEEIDLISDDPTANEVAEEEAQLEEFEISDSAIRVKSKTVTVKIWDDQQEDGDVVSIFLNGARIQKEMTVKKNEFIFTIKLDQGINIFKLLAHNEGLQPPNTAAILIDDGKEEYKSVLSSKKGEYAELKIVLE